MREYRQNYTQYYTSGTAARKLAQPEYIRPERTQETELPDYARVRKADRRKGLQVAMNPAFAVFLALSVVATLAVCALLLTMQAKVTNQNKMITRLQSEVEVLREDNNAYEARINSGVDLEYIRDVAINQLGMIYPAEGQVVYYDLTESDYVRQFQDIPETR